ncbi:tail assembly chaperone [Microbacterium phage Superfresh]|uniref:Tail assembly chaperone n=6 Tax=Ilzatvirus teagan TaxID=2845595 RepID=A0A6B9LV56_9CAUD|nr:tail assembly chaperone [Microbacterium phage Peep]AUX83291.1 tail assembly chaperone [Microbacterium phage Superfresh]AVO24406.1 tail assembly chaperone [Microbacterium phage AlexAdler]AVR56217.1 tail assembly chaperone [Microbacterium phage Dave]AVR56620.1 tail assembly chaperone [Microbacterium phage Antoinette]QHB47818.1 tail assembly chaperone [Microbacterium phage Renzie]UVD40570.1 tail assembly chaperone [Microbacterium phage Figueroism]
MSFSSYEELMQAVEERRQDVLTLEVDLGAKYSPEYEAAKQELLQAKAMSTIAGGFLSDNIQNLEDKVEALKPPQRLIWVQYSKLELAEWGMLMKQSNLTPLEQYEKVLPKVFLGLYGQDPVKPDDWDETHDEEWVKPEPLVTTGASVSSKGGPQAVVGGAQLHQLVNSFMSWQNSSGDVTIRPTKSGRD